MPVTSRPLKTTRPASGARWPVIKLNSVVLPAPFGPMIALIEPAGTLSVTPPTAWKPPKLFLTSRTSSTAASPERPVPDRGGRAREPSGKREQQHHENQSQDER